MRDLDRPLWIDQRPWLESWVAVVIDRDKRRALWVRHSLFVAEQGDPRATIWCAWFDADAAGASTTGPRAKKRLLPGSAMRAGDGDVLVHIDDSWLGRGGATGNVGDVSWAVTWTGGGTERTPLPSWLPAPSHARSIVHDADATGEVVVAGEKIAIAGRALVSRQYGKRRLPTRQWMWAPWLGGEPGQASVEMSAASLRDRFALGLAEMRIDRAVGERIRGRPASAAHPGGLVTATLAGPLRMVHARAWAEPEAMVGYAYRDSDGRDVMMAQSDAGSAQLEIWTRKLPGSPWHLVEDRRSAGGVAVEIQQHEPLPEVSYIGWDDEAAPVRAPIASEAGHEQIEWPELRAIAGVTSERGVGFARELACIAVASRDRPREPVIVPTPSGLDVAAAAATIDPELREALVSAGFAIPAVVDASGALAVIALADIDVEALAAGTPQPLALAAAIELSARMVEQVGEGHARADGFAAAATGFQRFAPVAARAWAPPGGFAVLPDLALELRVNGERRDQAPVRGSLAGILIAAVAALGRRLTRGDVVIASAAPSLASRLSVLQRRAIAKATDRVRRAELLASVYASSAALLRPGDHIEVSAGAAGRVVARLGV